jgi:hypothetical protein
MGFPDIEAWRADILAGRPQNGWVKKVQTFTDGNWHNLVVPASDWAVIVTDVFIGAIGTAGIQLSLGYGTTEVLLTDLSFEGKQFHLKTSLSLPVGQAFSVKRVVGSDNYRIAALGYFLRIDTNLQYL